MNTSESTAAISKALAEAQGEMKNANLDSENPHFGSKYASLASIRDATVPILAKHGIAVIQGTVYDGNGTLMAYTRLAHGEEWYESTYPIAIDKPQPMGSAMTYAKRYMLSAMCGISAEQDDDGNAAQEGRTLTASAKRTVAEPKAKTKTTKDAPTPDQLRELVKLGEAYGLTPEEITEHAKEQFGVGSVREVTHGQLEELRGWIALDTLPNQEEIDE